MMGVSSNGKTVGLHPADEGSTPSTVHCSQTARWWNGRHAVLRRPCPPRREGSSPPLVTGSCRPGGERDIMAPSEGAGPGSTPGRGTDPCFDGERDITRPCEGRVPGSSPGWSTVAEPKAVAGPGCEPGLCGFDSRRPPSWASAARRDEHPSCKGARAGSSPAAGSGSSSGQTLGGDGGSEPQSSWLDTSTGCSGRPAMLDRPGTALVTRIKWVRVPPPAL